MDNTVHIECTDVDGDYNTIKVEPEAPEYTNDATESSNNVGAGSLGADMVSYDLQTNMGDSGSDAPNQVVCVWESADDVEMGSTSLWPVGAPEPAATVGQDGAAQTDSVRNSSLKSQKTTRLWPISKLTGKKWQRRYSQALRPLKCTKCPETFLHKRSLHRHINIVHGPKVYFWCKRCCHFYNRRDNLRTHYRSHHPMYLTDVNHIQGVRREALITEGLPLPGNPQPSNSGGGVGANAMGSNGGKFPGGPRKHQLSEREQGAVKARLENSRLRTAFVQPDKDRPGGKELVQTASGPPKQSAPRPTPQKLTQVLPVVPQQDVGQSLVRRPGAKTPAAASAAASRAHPITISDILTHQLQRESSQAEEDVVVISEDSSSEGDPEPAPCSPGQGRDDGTFRRERGTPFRDLQVEKVMQGQVSRVTEEHQTFVYSAGEKVQSEARKRTYNVLYLGEVGEGSKQLSPQVSPPDGANPTSTDALGQNIQGRVTKVTEMSTKYTYADGKRVTKEKTTRVFDVMLLGGLQNM